MSRQLASLLCLHNLPIVNINFQENTYRALRRTNLHTILVCVCACAPMLQITTTIFLQFSIFGNHKEDHYKIQIWKSFTFIQLHCIMDEIN